MVHEIAKKETNSYRKFGLLDKVAYAAGDFGCSMSFSLAGTFFTLFYTQYMGIDSVTFAGILIVLKIWDAINDPLIGGIIDSNKRSYKLGKFKTFILFGSIGLMVSAALCFLPFPNAPQIVKVILCLFGYISWDACYTLVNVPYGSMISVISSNPGDRAQLSSWRSLGAMLAGLPIGIILPVILYDNNNELMGGRLFFVALALGFVGLLAFLFMIKNTVERVQTNQPLSEDAPKFNYIKSVKNFVNNRAALGATMLPVAMYLGTMGGATAVIVMFQSYFKNAALSGVMSLMSMLPMIVFLPFIGKIVNKWGKKEASQFGLIFSILAGVAMLVVPMPANNKGVLIFIVCVLANGLGMGISNCLGNAMMADAIDYNEWKNGVREEGVTYALHSFCRKLAQGIGPSICLILMVQLGYNEALGAAQPFEVAANIRYLVGGLYLASAVLMWIGVHFVYNLDKNTLEKIEKDLGRN